MAERQRYVEPRLNVQLQPQAAPVDTFVVAPQPVQDNSLADLARGLSKFDAGLQEFLSERDKKQQEEDRLRGEIEFHKSNRVGYAEAVQKGLIPAYASKSFVEGWKETEGRVAGYNLEQRFWAEYDKWGEKDSLDPTKFDGFLSNFIASNIGTADPAILKGLRPRLEAVMQQGFARNNSDRHQGLVRRNAEAAGAETNVTIDEGHARGLATKQGTDYEAVFKSIEAGRAKMMANGASGADLDQKFIDAITAKAIEKRDPKLLDFLERKVPGKDYTWAQTPYGQVQKGKTIESLEKLAREQVTTAKKAKDEADKKERDDTTRLAIESLATNPDAPFPEELMTRGSRVEPEFRTKVNTWRDNIRRNQGATNPEALKELTWEIIQSGGRDTDAILRKGIESGTLANKEDLTAAYKLAEDMKKNGNKIDGLLKSQAADRIRASIKERTSDKNSIENIFAPGGLSDAGLAATYDYERMLREWMSRNPNATPDEIDAATNSIGAAILGRVSKGADGMGDGQYARQAQFPNPYTQGRPAAGSQPTPQAAPQAQPQAQQPQAPANDAAGRIKKLREDAAYYAQSNPEAARQFTQQADQLEAQAKAPAAADPKAVRSWFDALPPQAKEYAMKQSLDTGRPLLDVITEGYQRTQGQAPAANPSQPPATGTEPQRQGALGGATTQPASVTTEDVGNVINAALQSAFGDDATPAQDVVAQIGGLIEQALGGSGGNTGSYTLAVLKDDPRAARILDFISGPESSGNYNAVFGNAKSNQDLSQFTVDQIIGKQRAARQAGAKSTATGRYQIIYKTLVGLKKQLGLSGDERFTPELQDRLALQLLRNRGYDRFAAGKMSPKMFALQLAQEWASLPDPRTGRSYYAGDGLNRSHVTPTQVASVLGD